MKQLLTLSSVLATVATISAASAEQINLQISGFSNDSGMARIILMEGAAGYGGEIEAERIVSVPIRNGVANWDTADVPPGRYALIAHHDTDSNNELDRPYFTLPLEPYGYSNGAWTSIGLPDWEEVAFDVGETPTIQSIHIRMNAFAALGQMALIGLPSVLVIFGGLALFRRRRSAAHS
ncbi:MAG: DUF2141 domain-containing protein [Boseongicola sp.]